MAVRVMLALSLTAGALRNEWTRAFHVGSKHTISAVSGRYSITTSSVRRARDRNYLQLHRISSTGQSKSSAGTASSSEKKPKAEIISEDQGGREFEPLADKDAGSETPLENQPTETNKLSQKEAGEDDQGGQEFEPLEAKRAADWSKQ